jgi:RNA polymerase sigma-70 factor (ECF subfamily)
MEDVSLSAPGDAGVERRLERLLAEYGGRLRRTVARLCPGGVDLDDVMQEISLRLWRALGRESEIAHPASYLQRVAATAVVDAVRRQRRRREAAPIDAPGEDGVVREPVSPGPSPEGAAARSRLLAAAAGALGRLPDNRRLAVRLYLQGFSSVEVAEIAGWTEPKARNLLYRGLGTLRRELAAAGYRYPGEGEEIST